VLLRLLLDVSDLLGQRLQRRLVVAICILQLCSPISAEKPTKLPSQPTLLLLERLLRSHGGVRRACSEYDLAWWVSSEPNLEMFDGGSGPRARANYTLTKSCDCPLRLSALDFTPLLPSPEPSTCHSEALNNASASAHRGEPKE
jgi:hypothetical protein